MDPSVGGVMAMVGVLVLVVLVMMMVVMAYQKIAYLLCTHPSSEWPTCNAPIPLPNCPKCCIGNPNGPTCWWDLLTGPKSAASSAFKPRPISISMPRPRPEEPQSQDGFRTLTGCASAVAGLLGWVVWVQVGI